MNKTGKRALALFILAYLLTLLITAPASLLDRGLHFITDGRLLLANTSGTVWRGAGTPALRGRAGNLIALEPLHWDVAVLPLFTAKIKILLRWDDLPSAAAMEASITFKQIELQHALLLLPAQALEEISPILKPAQFRGQFQIKSDRLVFSKRGTEGAAVVDWQQASSALSSIAPLGNYRLTLNGAGNSINIGLATTSGVLLLEGQGNWSAARGLDFHGKAQAAEGKQDSLAELLRHLGPQETLGVHTLTLTPQRKRPTVPPQQQQDLR